MSVRDRHERERLARREAILAAAMTVFEARGLDGATIEMIAREAEVAVGTIYLYFSSRDELFVTLMIEWIGGLRDRYVEIQSRALDPLEELRVMAGSYIDYLNRSRGLFVAQLSVSFSKLPALLARKEELDRFEEMRTLGRECFRLWADSVARVFDGGAGGSHGAATISTAMWAALNGAFLLSGDQEFFRDLTGLDATRLLTDVFDFQLAAAHRFAAPKPDKGVVSRTVNKAAKGTGAGARAGRHMRRTAPRRADARYEEASDKRSDRTDNPRVVASAGTEPRN